MVDSHKYSATEATTYDSIGIAGTSFEMSFRAAQKMLGDLTGKTALDFGSGTGRSANFLKQLGASSVIGLDHNPTMVHQAKQKTHKDIHFLLIGKDPLPEEESIDVALMSQVLMEMKSKDEMIMALGKIRKILKTNGTLILIVTNPMAYGHDFKSYSYPDKFKYLQSGDQVRCIIKGDQPFTITDYFWTEADYKQALSSAGFQIEETSYPLPESQAGWLDETNIAPDIVIKARKPIPNSEL